MTDGGQRVVGVDAILSNTVMPLNKSKVWSWEGIWAARHTTAEVAIGVCSVLACSFADVQLRTRRIEAAMACCYITQQCGLTSGRQ